MDRVKLIKLKVWKERRELRLTWWREGEQISLENGITSHGDWFSWQMVFGTVWWGPNVLSRNMSGENSPFLRILISKRAREKTDWVLFTILQIFFFLIKLLYPVSLFGYVFFWTVLHPIDSSYFVQIHTIILHVLSLR
jgi:hypothetical protein